MITFGLGPPQRCGSTALQWLVVFELAYKLSRVFAGQVVHHLYDRISLRVRALDAQDARLILSARREGNKHADQSCNMPEAIVCGPLAGAPDSLWMARLPREFGSVLFHEVRPSVAHAVLAEINVNRLDVWWTRNVACTSAGSVCSGSVICIRRARLPSRRSVER